MRKLHLLRFVNTQSKLLYPIENLFQKSVVLLFFIFFGNFYSYGTVISSNTTYVSPTVISDDLFVTNGAVLTIDGSSLSVNGNISVFPGSKLIIVNATLKVNKDVFLHSSTGSGHLLGAIMEVTNSTITSLNDA